MKMKKLPKEFYTRDVVTVAKELLGKYFIKHEKNFDYITKIVETEAYDGSIDEASHTFIGMTERNKIMFNEGGYLYVYFTYGFHYCANIVTGEKGKGTAVLIRAVEPIEPIDKMARNRFGRKLKSEKEIFNLTSGPGKVCQALKIDKKFYGIDLTGDKIFLADNEIIPEENIVVTHRIGIKKSLHLPWRFYIKNNPFVSKK